MALLKHVVFLSILAGCAGAAEKPAKNVILFLGDAGGIPTLHAASLHAYNAGGRLFVQRMPHIALSDTASASEWVTDSAAGMTAIVTGRRTNNGVLSQSDSAVRGMKDGEPLKTILEYAEERGLSTGVVSNSSIASATPAACYAQVNDRKEVGKIFAQALKPRFGDGVDVMIGPGFAEISEATGKLGIDLPSALAKRGYRFGHSLDAPSAGTRRAVILLSDDTFDLGAAAELAIAILSRNPKGFFLMVESDLHTNTLVRGIGNTVKFDRLIQSTAGRIGDDTLLMFTADHSFDLRIAGKSPRGEALFTVQPDGKAVPAKSLVIEGHHSAEQVLVAAQGPGAGRVRGFLANTDLFGIMMAAYGWKPEDRR